MVDSYGPDRYEKLLFVISGLGFLLILTGGPLTRARQRLPPQTQRPRWRKPSTAAILAPPMAGVGPDTDGRLRFIVIGDWGTGGDTDGGHRQDTVAKTLGDTAESFAPNFIISTGDQICKDYDGSDQCLNLRLLYANARIRSITTLIVSIIFPPDLTDDAGVQTIEAPQFETHFEIPYRGWPSLQVPWFMSIGNHVGGSLHPLCFNLLVHVLSQKLNALTHNCLILRPISQCCPKYRLL